MPRSSYGHCRGRPVDNDAPAPHTARQHNRRRSLGAQQAYLPRSRRHGGARLRADRQRVADLRPPGTSRAHRPAAAGAERGRQTARDRLRPALAAGRRPAPGPLVGRAAPLPAAEPIVVAGHAAEDACLRLQRRQCVRRLELPLPRSRAVRLHRCARPRPVPADGGRDRSVRDRAARPLHQRGGRRRWLPGLADRDRGHGPDLRPDVSAVRRRVADRRQRRRGEAAVHPGHGHGPAVPGRERVRRARRRADRARLHVVPVREGPRRRHRRTAVPQRQGAERVLGPRVVRYRWGEGALAVRVRRVSRAGPGAARLGTLRARRGEGRGHGQSQDARVRARGRRGLVRPVGRLLVRREGVRRSAPDPGRSVRAALLPHQPRQRHHAAQRLHGLRRHLLGLAARAGRLHLVRLRGGLRRGPQRHTQGRHDAPDRAVAAARAGPRQAEPGQGRARHGRADQGLPPHQPRHRRPLLRPAQRLRRGGHRDAAGGRDRRARHRSGTGRQADRHRPEARKADDGALDRAAHAEHDRRAPGHRGVRGTVRRTRAGRAGLRGRTDAHAAGPGTGVGVQPRQAQRQRSAGRRRAEPGDGRGRRRGHADAAAVRRRRDGRAAVAVRDPVRPAPRLRPGAAAVGGAARLHGPPHRRHHRPDRPGGVGAARDHPCHVERARGAHAAQRLGQSAGAPAAGRCDPAGPGRARRLAAADREPGGRAGLRRLGMDDGRPEDDLQHDPRARGAARPVRRRLRLPLRGRLVPGRVDGRQRHRIRVPRLQHGHTGPVDGLAGR